VLLSFAVAASSPSYARNDHDDEIEHSIIQQGFASSPIPKEKLNLKGKDVAQVALGSYLVNGAGDCNGCHTFPRFLRPGGTPRPTSGSPATTNFTGNVTGKGSDPNFGNPYLDLPGEGQPLHGQLKANTNVQHFLAGGRCFGFFMSRNLTPNDYGLPRGLTEAEFIQVMRQGKDVSCRENRAVQNRPIYNGVPDALCSPTTFPKPEAPGAGVSFNADVLQTMPWPTYHSMTDTDLKAIYAYLSALPQATACNAAENGCAGFSNNPVLNSRGVGANQYIYANTDDCPNNGAPVQPGQQFIGNAPPQ